MLSPLSPRGSPEPAPIRPGGPTVRATIRGRFSANPPPNSPRITARVLASLQRGNAPISSLQDPRESSLLGRISPEDSFSNLSNYEVRFEPVPARDRNNYAPPPVVVRHLASGHSVSVRMSLDPTLQERHKAAFANLKRLVVPLASHCEFELANATVRYKINGVEQQQRLDLRQLIAESKDPEASKAAAREYHQALQLVSNQRIPFNLDDHQVPDRQRISLRKEGDVSPHSVLSRLPALPTTEAIITDDSEIKQSFTSSVELVISLASRAHMSQHEIIEGLNRVGCMESLLSEFTHPLRQQYNSKKTKLTRLQQNEIALRDQLDEATGIKHTQLRAQVVQNSTSQQECKKERIRLEELLQKTNVDRFALYMGLMFAPDTAKAATSGEMIKAADKQANQAQQSLGGYLEEKEKEMQPSLGKRFLAQLPGTKPLDKIESGTNYAINVGSLVYGHLPSIEAQKGSQDWMVRNTKKSLAPSREAAWIGLLTLQEREPLPAQIDSFIRECAEVLFPTYQERYIASTKTILESKKQLFPLNTFTRTPPIADQLWNYYMSPTPPASGSPPVATPLSPPPSPRPRSFSTTSSTSPPSGTEV